MASNKIENNVVVSIAYRLIVDGELLEEADSDDPLEYLHGHENIVPGLERELAGKKIGDTFTITLQPEDAYGDYDEEDTDIVERGDMPDDIEEGMELLLEDEYGNMFEATIKEINDNGVLLDFNPPLAGQVITYEIEVLDIRDAEEDELDHGHPHSYHEDMEFE